MYQYITSNRFKILIFSSARLKFVYLLFFSLPTSLIVDATTVYRMDSRRIKSEDEEEIDQLADDDNSTSNNSVVELARLNHLEYCLKVLETGKFSKTSSF